MNHEIEKLENDIKKLQQKIKAIKNSNSRYRPEIGDDYFFIDDEGVAKDCWHDEEIDEVRYTLNNVLRTKKEAEFKALKNLAIAKLEISEGAREFIFGKENWLFHYDHMCNKLSIFSSKIYQHMNIYFDTKDHAKTAWDKLTPQELNVLVGKHI